MARVEDTGLKASTVSATADSVANTAATATIAAPGVKSRLFITNVTVSIDSTPSTAPDITVKSGTTVLYHIVLPAVAATATVPVVLNFPRPLQCGVNELASVTCGAIGGSGKSYVNIAGFPAAE